LAPGGTDVTCTGVPGALKLGTLKLGLLKLGKLKLGILGSAPQPERATQLTNKVIARPLIPSPYSPRPQRMTEQNNQIGMVNDSAEEQRRLKHERRK
jgi:hypothetical protein